MFQDVRYLKSETAPDKLGPCIAEAAFVGRSNVGKSSLLNALCRSVVARVSGSPGRTRMINVFLVGRDRWLVDLPGYGYTQARPEKRTDWGTMIEGYLLARSTLRMVFVLIDAKVGPTSLDMQMLEWLKSKGMPLCIVATKADQVKPSLTVARRRDVARAMSLTPEDLVWVSAKEDSGLTGLRARVAGLLA